MPELTTAQVATYTGGRLAADSLETSRLLALALEAARDYCRWHVAPVRAADPFVLDGSGTAVLLLPTLRLQSLDSIAEDGVSLDPASLRRSAAGHRLQKRSGAAWTAEIGSIEGTMTHGLAAAPKFDQAVLMLLDRLSYYPEGGRPRVIGPIQYDSEGEASPFTAIERGLLDGYRIELPA